jgi:hypothetical protein
MDFADRFVTVAKPLVAFDQVHIDLVALRIGTMLASTRLSTIHVPIRGWSLDALLHHIDEFLNEVTVAVDAPAGLMEREGSLNRLHKAFHRPGYVHERGPTPLGIQPGAVMIQYVVNELVAHSWDLSTAINSRCLLPDWLVERCLLSWKVYFDTFGRPAEHFDPEREAPPNASAATILAAFLGREIPDTPMVLWRDPALLAAELKSLRTSRRRPAQRPRLTSGDAMQVLFSEMPDDWDPAWL